MTVSNTGPAGQVAAYSFDEGSGTTANDASGNGNNGTVANATWVAGKYGCAYFTGAANSMVTMPNSASLGLTAGMTLEAWVNPTSLQQPRRQLGRGHRQGQHQETATKSATPFTRPPARTRPRPSTSWWGDRLRRGTSVLPLNAWTFLAATYDGTTLKMYVGNGRP